MSWEDKLRDYLKEKGFGIYIVELKDPFFFEVKGNQYQIRIIRTQTYSLEARHPLGMRTLIGVHRRARDRDGESLTLEIFEDFNAVIPYQHIKNIERICDDQYRTQIDLEGELRKAAGDIITRNNHNTSP